MYEVDEELKKLRNELEHARRYLRLIHTNKDTDTTSRRIALEYRVEFDPTLQREQTP